MPEEPVAINSPFCGSLRSKKFFMLDRLATSADEYLDATNHVWCCETQEVIGLRMLKLALGGPDSQREAQRT